MACCMSQDALYHRDHTVNSASQTPGSFFSFLQYLYKGIVEKRDASACVLTLSRMGPKWNSSSESIVITVSWRNENG